MNPTRFIRSFARRLAPDVVASTRVIDTEAGDWAWRPLTPLAVPRRAGKSYVSSHASGTAIDFDATNPRGNARSDHGVLPMPDTLFNVGVLVRDSSGMVGTVHSLHYDFASRDMSIVVQWPGDTVGSYDLDDHGLEVVSLPGAMDRATVEAWLDA